MRHAACAADVRRKLSARRSEGKFLRSRSSFSDLDRQTRERYVSLRILWLESARGSYRETFR